MISAARARALNGALIVMRFPNDVGCRRRRATHAQQTEFFESRIRPIHLRALLSCHGRRNNPAVCGSIHARASWKDEHGPMSCLANRRRARWCERFRQTGAIKMPPKSKLRRRRLMRLSPDQEGAPWPEVSGAGADTGGKTLGVQ